MKEISMKIALNETDDMLPCTETNLNQPLSKAFRNIICFENMSRRPSDQMVQFSTLN